MLELKGKLIKYREDISPDGSIHIEFDLWNAGTNDPDNYEIESLKQKIVKLMLDEA